MKVLIGILVLLISTSCSYNINNSVGGNVTTTTTGNTFRGYTPTIVNRTPAIYSYSPNPALISAYCYTPPFYAYSWYRPWGWYW